MRKIAIEIANVTTAVAQQIHEFVLSALLFQLAAETVVCFYRIQVKTLTNFKSTHK